MNFRGNLEKLRARFNLQKFVTTPTKSVISKRKETANEKQNMNSTATTVPPVVLVAAKETWIAYVLWFFLGFLGVHKFYLGKTGWGILYILTGGIFCVGLLIDLFTIPIQVRHYNQRLLNGGCWK